MTQRKAVNCLENNFEVETHLVTFFCVIIKLIRKAILIALTISDNDFGRRFNAFCSFNGTTFQTSNDT